MSNTPDTDHFVNVSGVYSVKTHHEVDITNIEHKICAYSILGNITINIKTQR